MKRYEHGGNIYRYHQMFSHDKIIDFSANINPYGIPEQIKQSMHNAVEKCINYPDPYSNELRQSLALYYCRQPNNFFCSNGAADIIYRLVHSIRPRHALIPQPTFSEYETALNAFEVQISYYLLEEKENFMFTDRFLLSLNNIDICFLCNPNNPTGTIINDSLLLSILEKCDKKGIWLIIDECFLDFLPDESKHTVINKLEKFKKLVVVRAFTKMYAIPGIRLGWCVSANEKLISKLYEVGQPWNTSVIAQACGVAAIGIEDYPKKIADRISVARQYLYDNLKSLGFKVWNGRANFLLFYTQIKNLHEHLLSHGILIRDCSNYIGLGQGYYRIAVRTQSENEFLISKLKEVCINWQR